MVVATAIIVCSYLASLKFSGRDYPVEPQKILLANEKIDPNTADFASLRRLPLVGDSRAASIIKYRQANMPTDGILFTSAEDLTKIKGYRKRDDQPLEKPPEIPPAKWRPMSDRPEPISQAAKRKRRKTPREEHVPAPPNFASIAHKPINQLVVILPLLVIFHVGSYLAGRSNLLMPVYIQNALEWVGLNIPFFTAGVILIVLVCQQLMHHESWKINGWSVLRIYLESILWVLPLVALAWLTTNTMPASILPPQESPAMDIIRKIMGAIGAGVYEEFVFRLVLLQGLLLLFIDILKSDKFATTIISIFVVSVVFTACHFTMGELTSLTTLNWSRVIFLLLAGCMWGVLAVWKGYAYAACSHVWWDLLVVGWEIQKTTGN